ncbi:Di-copper centre-containing protein [Martensiomyces pterosporus]|nr:Di-copper centre-containing protein [Martensiomyces pterosporus]
MKLTSYCLRAILAQVLVCLTGAQDCSRMVTRRDIMMLSPQDWDRTASVFQRMYQDGWFRYFATMHSQEFGNIHGNENFFPWHRRFLREVEEIGQRYDGDFSIPYWDELRDSRNPAGSPVLTPQFVGGNGFGGCVRDGLQAGWTLPFPNRHCLVRRFDQGGRMQPWYSAEYIYSIMQRYDDMHGLRENIEYTLHGSVHLGVGGDMAQYWSPNDFIFFLHHANLDRLWDEWQHWGHMWTMDGRDSSGRWMTVDSPIAHYGDTVGSTMQLGAGRMCYMYDSSGPRKLKVSTDRDMGSLALVSKPSTKVDSNSEEANLAMLPERLLKKWFPSLANSTKAAVMKGGGNNFNTTRGAWNTGGKSGGKSLVYPAPLAASWISMHKFNPDRVARVMREAREFVDDLNAAKYLSPY